MAVALSGLQCRARLDPLRRNPTSDLSEPPTPRTPRSPHLTTCSASTIPPPASPRLPRRRWPGTPHAAAGALAAEAPPTPRTPLAASASPSSGEAGQQTKPVYDCFDVATQSLAVNLTLDEYKQTLVAASLAQQLADAPAPAPGAPPAGPAPAATLTHLTLTSADLEAMGLCNHCRYPCYLSGMPACEASHYLQMWDSDAPLKPRGFDAATSLRLRGVADIAAVSSGGRANGQWKPDNQDSFLVQPTASKHGGTSGSSSDEDAAAGGAGEPAAAAIGVFDGHGRLGGQAAAIVRQAMAERLGALSSEQAAEAAERGLAGAASLLDSCFTAADAALADSGKDFSKSGCTAVLALLDRDSVSVAWAGDSRAVLGVCDSRGSLLGSTSGSLDSESPSPPGSPAASSSGSGSYDGTLAGPMCAAVPLTEDHKPDKPGERQRITAAGGRVTRLATDRYGNPAGPFRVFVPNAWSPGLALSRAFGDTLASTVGVTSKPEVTVLPLPSPATPPPAPAGISNAPAGTASYCSAAGAPAGPAARERHVLIVASDGLWEWVSNAQAVGIASLAPTAEDAAHALVEAAHKQWAVRYRGRNCDDVTVVVAFLDR